MIDAHHHLWERTRFSYPWLAGHPVLDRDFTLEEYERTSAACGIEHSVFVQAETEPRQGLDESRWALSLAASGSCIAGVVAWAPVESPSLPAYLDELGTPPQLKGIRRLIQQEPDPNFCARSEFIAGVREVARRHLAVDICVYHYQLPAVIELVRAVPQARFVLDHLGKPDIAAGRMQPWADDLRVLAACPNVVCKLSGVATEADHRRWVAADLLPYIHVAIEAFGYERLMFGSDWPVSLQAISYQRWVQLVEQAIAAGGPTARAQVFAGTAVATYGLEV